MSKLIINNNEDMLLYPVKSDSFANLSNVLDCWIKFLSYFKIEELLYLSEMNNRNLSELTMEEVERYLKIKNQKIMLNLFVKYKNRNCTREEHDQVIKFMNNSLKVFMKERLTEEELKKSYVLLAEFRQMSKSELDEYINKQESRYDNLSVLEAYVLYEVKEIRYIKNSSEMDDSIRDEQVIKENSLRKSLVRYFGLR